MKQSLRKTISVAAALSALTVGIQQASATILISDNFNRNGALNGSTVDVGAQNWVSAAGGHNNTTTANGGQEIGGWNARLAFTPETGKQYQLTLTVGPTLQNALQVAFAYDTGGFGDYNWLQQDVHDMAYARIGQVLDYGNYVADVYSVAGTYTLDANTGPGYVNTLDLILDTTGGLSSAAMTWKINGVTKGTWTANVSTYNSIVFGRGDGPNDPNSTQISDLTLQTIPEPTTGLIFFLGSVALGLWRRTMRG